MDQTVSIQIPMYLESIPKCYRCTAALPMHTLHACAFPCIDAYQLYFTSLQWIEKKMYISWIGIWRNRENVIDDNHALFWLSLSDRHFFFFTIIVIFSCGDLHCNIQKLIFVLNRNKTVSFILENNIFVLIGSEWWYQFEIQYHGN